MLLAIPSYSKSNTKLTNYAWAGSSQQVGVFVKMQGSNVNKFQKIDVPLIRKSRSYKSIVVSTMKVSTVHKDTAIDKML
jgi:hypothetical protein